MNLFDTDLYKFTESQFAWWYYPNVLVKFALTSRSGMDIFKYVDPRELQDLLDEPIQRDELYLRELSETPGFLPGYVEALQEATFPRVRVTQDRVHPITVSGPWWTTTLWETQIMSAVSELCYRGRADLCEAEARLAVKRNVLSMLPKKLNISDFGTRRRLSREWQTHVVHTLNRDGLLAGTSNFALAIESGLPCVGTMPHAVFMIPAALVDDSRVALRATPQVVMEQWRNLYGHDYSIALTDTFGTQSFLRDMDEGQSRVWSGLRHDSGSPLEWATQVARHYYTHDVRSRKKLVFSDGLVLPMILTIEHHWGEKFDCTYGWGTNLTNSTGREPLDIIVKPIMADGRLTVKLSDVASKALSDDMGKMTHYRSVFT